MLTGRKVFSPEEQKAIEENQAEFSKWFDAEYPNFENEMINGFWIGSSSDGIRMGMKLIMLDGRELNVWMPLDMGIQFVENALIAMDIAVPKAQLTVGLTEGDA